MSTHVIRSEPVGGPLLTRPFKILGAMAAVGVTLVLWRFAAGLGASTALNDGYPWGLWIAFDVVVGTALACGGYAVAILVYVLNRGRYHPLVRSALLTSALGYTLGGVGVMIDLGRFWNTVKVPVLFWQWNLHSVLLEVALCIMLYTFVLWIELSPAFLEKWRGGQDGRLRRFSLRASPVVERALPWLIALGLLLPTMHQSSLGSLMILSGPKLHPLWQTPLLPLLFLVSCVGMGYAAVIMETALSGRAFGRRPETETLASLSGPMRLTLWLYVAIRLVDLAARGRLGLVLTSGGYGLLFAVEMGLFAGAALMLGGRARVRDLGHLFRAALVIAVGGALYRFSTFLIAYDPGGGWSYFPAVTEILITVGLVSAEIMAYIYIVKLFPILAGTHGPATPRAT
jgi:Ni/Fe-hydrogenase subunit HybB-like protein